MWLLVVLVFKFTSQVMAIYLACIFFISAAAAAAAQSNVTDNPADQLVAEINSNRTASKSPALYSNPGLGCIALQYIKAYDGDCGLVGGPKAKKPLDSEFADTFAPNCGVQASTLAPITGRLLGCQSKYVSPSRAFSEILMKNNRSLEIVGSKNHTEIGAAVSGSGRGGPFFWCVLFSGGKRNNSFVAQDGVVKVTAKGCFSGANDACSAAVGLSQTHSLGLWLIALAAAFASILTL